jgi:hypothetical protein
MSQRSDKWGQRKPQPFAGLPRSVACFGLPSSVSPGVILLSDGTAIYRQAKKREGTHWNSLGSCWSGRSSTRTSTAAPMAVLSP